MSYVSPVTVEGTVKVQHYSDEKKMDTSNNSLSQPTAMTMDTDIHNLYAVSICHEE